ncbi:TetR family transcriptional regulator, partial [Actinomadura sp. NPDC023710]|uniref:TetR family transcriptional regulator n=1 Tax=Actinomadura sp. NPDC023710 TaxID=3158219 RepID=UPI0033C6AB19
MDVQPRATGAVRPGGRTARTRAAVLAATQGELEEAGYAGLTLEKVAERSGVHLATLYRRWR